MDNRKVKTISYSEYASIYQSSVHNANADAIMLEKYDGGDPTSYISKAGKDYTYFDLGKEWGTIREQYGFSNEDMFKLFNEPFLDDAINQGKTIYFSHNPLNDTGFLGQELEYLKNNGYVYDMGNMSASFDASKIGMDGLVR